MAQLLHLKVPLHLELSPNSKPECKFFSGFTRVIFIEWLSDVLWYIKCFCVSQFFVMYVFLLKAEFISCSSVCSLHEYHLDIVVPYPCLQNRIWISSFSFFSCSHFFIFFFCFPTKKLQPAIPQRRLFPVHYAILVTWMTWPHSLTFWLIFRKLRYH